jgi:hypothetical protein
LGSASTVSLQQARDLADDYRSAVAKGLDPLAEKRRAAGSGSTFETVLDE